MFQAEIIADSVSPDGRRITTGVFTYPRFVHSEVLTHRDRARNSASSRAIPWRKFRSRLPTEDAAEYAMNKTLIENFSEMPSVQMLHPKCMMQMILTDPVIPIVWGAEKAGMQTGNAVSDEVAREAEKVWLAARDHCVAAADKLAALGIHKSLCNRLTEPWMWITVIMTATEWNNFYRLRVHPDAEVHFQRIAGMIKDARNASTPRTCRYGEWHTPFVQGEEAGAIMDEAKAGAFGDRFALDPRLAVRYISAGRCARVSYLTHDGKRDLAADVELCKRLIERSDDVLHASPLEHVACCDHKDQHSGPFRGWRQFRKEFPNENVQG